LKVSMKVLSVESSPRRISPAHTTALAQKIRVTRPSGLGRKVQPYGPNLGMPPPCRLCKAVALKGRRGLTLCIV
jgi:hypothetical protein